jgi:UDP-N-acetylmuramate dehydrogenase
MDSVAIEKIQRIVESCKKENPGDVEVCYRKPMAELSTFRAGGPADCWLRPCGDSFPAFAASLIAAARAASLPVFVLGGGANILASDAGIRGIVLDTGGWTGETGGDRQEGILQFRAGTSLDAAAEIAANAGLSGLEFLAGMPGSIGGAVWMNARCYGREIADVLVETGVIDFSDNCRYVQFIADRGEFGYKKSPFQSRDMLILSANFRLTSGKTPDIRAAMDDHRADREAKGHYRYPSAGSVFKNNPNFGKPTGKIIDELGLCGLRKGGAQVAPWHGNIIVNTGGAAASDIRALVDEVAARVKAAAGLTLEPEILFVGEWC